MNQKLDNKLVKAFPLLYRDRHAHMSQTCMYWGFCCGSGWFDLIWKLSGQLERIISKMTPDMQKEFRAAQVKEKFGTLRFYMSSSTGKIGKLISAAESKSARTCENCGKGGKLCITKEGWYKILCTKCTAKDVGRRGWKIVKRNK